MTISGINTFALTGSNTFGEISQGANLLYVMRGRYIPGANFEYWVATNPKNPPPSGHTLIYTTILGSNIS
jgi:hypothetical protein